MGVGWGVYKSGARRGGGEEKKRVTAAGQVPGADGMMIAMLGSGLESIENSKYSSLSWT